MKEYGYVVTSYKGTYRINSNSEVTVRFDDFKHEWPIMLLQKDSISLLLRPKNGPDFVMGNRGGATTRGAKEAIGPSDRCPPAKIHTARGSASERPHNQEGA